MKHSLVVASLMLTAATAVSQTSQPQPAAARVAAPGPSLELSLEAAQTAMAACAANGYKVAVTVIDSAGVTRVALAADGVGAGPVSYSVRKANTSLKYGEASIAIQEKVKSDAAMATAINEDSKLIARGGAQPLISKGTVIGAIGVGGAPGGDKDDVCALAAVEKIKGRL